MHIDCHEGDAPSGWDDRILDSAAVAGLGQTAFRARYLRRVDGALPLFLQAVEDGRVIASLLLLQTTPFDRALRAPRNSLADILSGERAGGLEWMDGPVFHDQALAPAVLRELLQWIDTHYRSAGLSFVRCRRLALGEPLAGQAFVDEAFRAAGYVAYTWATFLVDLTDTENVRWDALHRAIRKNIRKCRREDVRIRKLATFDAFREGFYEPYRQAETEAGRVVGPLTPYEDLFEEDTEGYYAFLVAETSAGEPLGTLGMYCVGGVATEIASSVSSLAISLKLAAQDLLHWEAMTQAVAAECHTFNLAGVAPAPANPKEEGIRRFKEKWGGRYAEYAYYEKSRVHRRWARRAWQMAKRIRGNVQ